MSKGKKLLGIIVSFLLMINVISITFISRATENSVTVNLVNSTVEQGQLVQITGQSPDDTAIVQVTSNTAQNKGSIIYYNAVNVNNNHSFGDSFRMKDDCATGEYLVSVGKGQNIGTNRFTVVLSSQHVAEEEAAKITSITKPAKDATQLTLPTAGQGCSVTIERSSNESVISRAGVIVPPSSETVVKLVLRVTKNDKSALTGEIDVTVPAKTVTGGGGGVIGGGSTGGSDTNTNTGKDDNNAGKVVDGIGKDSKPEEVTKAFENLAGMDLSPDKAADVLDKLMDKVTVIDEKIADAIADMLDKVGKVTLSEVKTDAAGKTVATVDAKAVSASVDKALAELNDILGKVKEKGSEILANKLKENVSINFEVAEGNDGKGAAELNLPAESIKLLQEKHIGFKLSTKETVITVPSNAIDSSLLTNGKYLRISKQPSTEAESKKLTDKVVAVNSGFVAAKRVFNFEASIVDGNSVKKIDKFNNSITVDINTDTSDIADRRKAGVYYVSEDGKFEFKGGKVTKTGVSFKTGHFSAYVIMQYNKTFKDIDKSWAKDQIEVLASRHITVGVDTKQTQFAPLGTVTRAQFAQFIINAFQIGTSEYKGLFTDVSKDKWYAKAIEAAKEAGIVDGIASNKFAPEDKITREQMAKMVMKAYELKTGGTTASLAKQYKDGLKDMKSVSDWAVDYVKAASALGLIQGNTKSEYKPANNATRQEIAKILIGLLTATNEI